MKIQLNNIHPKVFKIIQKFSGIYIPNEIKKIIDDNVTDREIYPLCNLIPDGDDGEGIPINFKFINYTRGNLFDEGCYKMLGFFGSILEKSGKLPLMMCFHRDEESNRIIYCMCIDPKTYKMWFTIIMMEFDDQCGFYGDSYNINMDVYEFIDAIRAPMCNDCEDDEHED